MQLKKLALIAASLAVVSGAAFADNVLIVNGLSSSSEPGTTTNITNNWTPTCGTGHTVTVVDKPPASLTGYQQIWDLRFSNSSPLTPADQAAYLAFLQGGGNMFVMGENSAFMTRNNSVTQFVATAGGGALTFVAPGDTQNVNGAPFNDGGLNTISYATAGGTTSPGSGVFATNNGTGGSALAWSTGTLTNAPAGSLTVVFDVNFMEDTAPSDQHQFFQNLCKFVQTGGGSATATAVPANSSWGLLGLAALLAALAPLGLRLRKSA